MLDWLYAFAGDRAQNMVQLLEQHQRRMYRELTGHDMDASRLKALKEELRPWVAATPLRRMATTLVACLSQPHLINEENPARPKAYALLVRQGMGGLQPFRWERRDGRMVKRYGCLTPADRHRSQRTAGGKRRATLNRGKARLRAR